MLTGSGVVARLLRRPARPIDGAPTSAGVFANAEPFQGGEGRAGVLVLHGFTGSPRSMRPWADQLVADGFRVALPRLPGHGTSWQEANRTEWQDWYGCADAEFGRLAAECDHVFIAALSMGGSLAVRLAEQHPDRVSGLALVNPSIASADPRMAILPALSRVVPSLGAIANDIALPEILEGAYDRTPLRAAASLTRLWADVQAGLGKVEAPLLVFKSRVDHVVGPRSLALLRKRVRSRELTVVPLERSYHVATLDHDAPLIFTMSTAFFRRLAGGAAP